MLLFCSSCVGSQSCGEPEETPHCVAVSLLCLGVCRGVLSFDQVTKVFLEDGAACAETCTGDLINNIRRASKK